jgi:GAF domain-containing protein
VARDVTSLKRAESVQAAQYWISEAAYSAENLDQLYREVHRVICQLLPAENFCVTMYEQSTGTLSYPYLVDERAVPLESKPVSEDAALVRIIREDSGMLLHANDVTGADAMQPSPQHPPNWLGMPLMADEYVTGALVVHSRRDGVHYTEDDQQLLQFVSIQVATAIQRKKSEERLRRMAAKRKRRF